eukprot:2484929-Alexandrium_andersonii.AAC.1
MPRLDKQWLSGLSARTCADGPGGEGGAGAHGSRQHERRAQALGLEPSTPHHKRMCMRVHA